MIRVLRTRGLPILRQLQLEEALLRADKGNWLLLNDGCDAPAIVLGISGDADQLTHVEAAKQSGVQLIRRFSGGGTVIVDANTIFSTLIFQSAALPSVEPYPRPIMEFTGNVYGDVFATLEREIPPSAKSDQRHKVQHLDFQLHQNDYTFGDRKVGGNAQAIVKDRWLHHTSFLWDFKRERMALLKEPVKRPEYRGARKHTSFVRSLLSLGFRRQDFIESIEDAFAARGFQLRLATLAEVEECLERQYLRTTRLLD